MIKRHSRKRAGFKRPKTPEKSGVGRNGSKRRRGIADDVVNRSPSPNLSSDSEKDEIKQVEVEESMAYREPTMYDSLLKTLGSRNKSVRDDEEEEEEEDVDDDDEEEVDGEDDIDSGDDAGNRETESKDEDDESEGNDEDDNLCVNSESDMVDTSLSMISSFSAHSGHKLSNKEIDKLSKKKWSYNKKKSPVPGMSNCKWIGTENSSSLVEIENKFTVDNGYGLLPKLYKHWLDTYTSSGAVRDFDSSMQRYFFTLFNRYQDILHFNKNPFYLEGGKEEDSSVMDAYIMHSLNHVIRSGDLVKKNDAKVSKNQVELASNDDGAFLDHGFTRPKVLILLPLASIAFRVVKKLIKLTPSTHKVNVEHLDRFSDDFGIYENEDKNSSKPADYNSLFGGNNNDHFMIGIKFTKKSIKLYNDFYTSDMIIASPLGIITKIGEAEAEKEKDVDYLSSIEVLIIDHADVISMQNWSHVNTVVEQLNRIPSKQHGTDVMRIRQWYLDGHAQFYRQTIILSSYLNPEINALFNHHCVNFQGNLKLKCDYKGVLHKVLIQVYQNYFRFSADSIVDEDDARLDFFAKKVYPKIKNSVQGGVMLFISSYFEFVRIRNFLKSQNESFCLLGEYTKQSDISRSRTWFFEGKKKIMLYTERAHFYHRYQIRGIQNLIIYSLPERKEFYTDIVNMLDGSSNMTCTVLFSRFDQFRLERIVGTVSAKKMMNSDKDEFLFG